MASSVKYDVPSAPYPTISSALLAAHKGDRIVVKPGIYRENLVISKAVTIEGTLSADNSLTVTIRSLTANGIVVRPVGQGFDGMVSLRRIRVKCEGDGLHNGVVIEDGASCELQECEVISNTSNRYPGCGVLVRGVGSRVSVKSCRVHHCKGPGVWISAEATGEVLKSTIDCNGASGIQISGKANGVIKDNRIQKNWSNGVILADDASADVSGNEIKSNWGSGARVCDGANPVIKANKIRENELNGVWIHSNGRGEVAENEISANGWSAVEIESGGDPLVVRNRITKYVFAGINVGNGGKGTLRDNSVKRDE